MRIRTPFAPSTYRASPRRSPLRCFPPSRVSGRRTVQDADNGSADNRWRNARGWRRRTHTEAGR